MTQSEAIGLIEKGIPKIGSARWVDLGAGTGVFTKALAALIGKEGTVYAVDKEGVSLEKINSPINHATIKRLQLDFVNENIPVKEADGILLANSFHYVRDKELLIAKLKKILAPDGRLVFIEYDTLTSNPWIPHPIDFRSLHALMLKNGFSSIIKLKDRASIFNRASMYAAVVT